jgi:hypothetical protein
MASPVATHPFTGGTSADMLTSIRGTIFPLASDRTIVAGLDSDPHTSVFSGHGPHPTPSVWGPSITNRGERKAMKR